MKKRFLSLFLAVCMVLTALAGFTSCNENPSGTKPQKLTAPVVTLTDNVAAWSPDEHADRFEISIDGNLSYVENSVTQKTLAEGQTFKIRAVGDGVSYSTSDWSNSVTYTAAGSLPQAKKLATPSVTVSASGLASWTAVENASGYAYKIDGGEENSVTATAVQLSDGQSICVKAIGDGTNYTDSDYSTVKTYTQGTSVPSEAPAYLGIFASDRKPSESDGLPDAISLRPMMLSQHITAKNSTRAFEALLDEYFENTSHHLNESFPAGSDYGVYAKSGETVYIQIWLNNPNQHTILSLKLNGTKYQVGGGLSSFFIEENGQRYNCIYVAVTIPNGSYRETAYTVTDIEYIADTYINADGSDRFMNENDTVKIGLPYQEEKPAISDFSENSLTVNACSVSFTLADGDGLSRVSGGWLGVALTDGSGILVNKEAKPGKNSFSAAGLEEGSSYRIVVYLYADLHDGNGVYTHILFTKSLESSEALTVDEISGSLLFDAERDGYYAAIRVNTTLNSDTASYLRLEILNDEGRAVYTDPGYNGTASVSKGIAGGSAYSVRVYYKDTEYPDGKFIEEHVWVDHIGTPWYREDGMYPLVSDAVHHFQLNNLDGNYPIVDRFTLRYYDEESARWVAQDVLYLLENPHATEELDAQIEALWNRLNELPRGEEMDAVYQQIEELEARRAPLEYARWYLENRADNNRDKAYWQAEKAKGKYYYEITYNGIDTETVFKIGQTFYVILEDALALDGGNQYRSLKLAIDYETPNGVSDTLEASVSLDNHFICNLLALRDIDVKGNRMTFTLVNIDDYMLPNGGESVYEKGYLYKIVAHPGTMEETVLYLNESNPGLNVDEQAWFAEYIRLIKAGESTDGLHERFIPKYKESYSITIDGSKINAGITFLQIYTRFMARDYAEGEYEDCVNEPLILSKQLDKPTVIFDAEGGRGSSEGSAGWESGWEYEAKDQNGNPVTLDMQDSHRFALPAVGTAVRAKRLGSDYWLDSEWSEWYTFEGIRLPAPVLGEYDTARCQIGWSDEETRYISHYVYTVNGGTAIRAELDGRHTVMLNNGDVLRVKSVPNAEGTANGYLDGEWAEYICTDNRTALSVPVNTRIADKLLWWDAVDGAMYYVVEETYNGRTLEKIARSNHFGVIPGRTYRVRALPEDQTVYRTSAWSDSITYTAQ